MFDYGFDTPNKRINGKAKAVTQEWSKSYKEWEGEWVKQIQTRKTVEVTEMYVSS